MPCDGYKDSKAAYRDVCCEIEELLCKFGSAETIVCGDLNASLHRNPPSSLDPLLMKLCSQTNMTLPKDVIYPVTHTFKPHGRSSSLIDYFLCRADSTVVIDVSIDDCLLNTSDHMPVVAALDRTVVVIRAESKVQLVEPKPNWTKADHAKLQLYNDNAKEGVDSLRRPTGCSGWDVEIGTLGWT